MPNRLKKEYKDIVGAVIKPQCELVLTVDDRDITIEDTNRWWEQLKKVERSIGISKKLMTDEIGGTYRTPHDHILLYNMPENVLNAIAGIKMYDDYTDKIVTIEQLVQVIKNVFKR